MSFRSFSHKEKFMNKLVALHDQWFHKLQFDRFDDDELTDFRVAAKTLGSEINAEAGFEGMIATLNYLGTHHSENFGHDTIDGESARVMRMLLEKMWDGIGEWRA